MTDVGDVGQAALVKAQEIHNSYRGQAVVSAASVLGLYILASADLLARVWVEERRRGT